MHGTSFLASWRSTSKQVSRQNVNDKFSTTTTQDFFFTCNSLFQWRNLWNILSMILCDTTPERTVHTSQHSGLAYCPHQILPWRQKLQVLPKLWYTSTKLYGFTTQKAVTLIFSDMGTSISWMLKEKKNLAMLHVPYEHFQRTLTSISWLFHEKSNFTMSNVPHNHCKQCLSYSTYLMCSAD